MDVEALEFTGTSRGPKVRKPGAVGFEWERERLGAATNVTSYLEIAGLGFALTAVAGVLPLVMLLHH